MVDWVLKINGLSSSSSFTSSNQLFSICSMSASCYVSVSHHLQRPSHFVCCSTTVSLCVSLNDRLTLCVAQRPSHFVCRSTTVSLCVLLNDRLTLCVAQRPSHFVCCSTTVSLCVLLNDHLTLCVAGSSPTSASVSACVLTVVPTTRCGTMRRAAVAVRMRHRVARRARKRRERATCTMTTTGASK